MLHQKLTRGGIVLAFGGLAVLIASFVTWKQSNPYRRVVYATYEYRWVADWSEGQAVQRDEVWFAQAACVRPYLVKKKDEVFAKKAAFERTMPEEVRVWQNSQKASVAPLEPPPSARNDYYAWQMKKFERDRRENEEALYALKLREKYFDWYSARSRWEEEAKSWEGRVDKVSDKEGVRSEIIQSRTNELRAKSAWLELTPPFLGMASTQFSDTEAMEIHAKCIKIVPVKQIVTSTKYQTDLGQWLVEHAFSFWCGTFLLIFGLCLGPVGRWVAADR